MLFRAATLFLYCFCLLALPACRREQTLFKQLKPAETGIDFANTITERDTVNIMDMEYVYNGGGVGVGDLNGDGLEDLYFTGSQVDNKLYLNKGGMRFQDVTEAAGVRKKNQYQWSSGINILDINLDGRRDIYVCNTANPDPELRRNLLFVNQGNDGAGIPLFREMAAEYGIDDPGYSSHAQFFDYDNDGDLDLFVGVNLIHLLYPNQYITLKSDGSDPTRDLLFRNDWNETLKHPVFTDVSLQAGIVWAGYSHSTLICDFNNDGWQDIYVANDFVSNDLLYLNNGNGTFTNRIAELFKHQSYFSMGSDLGDFDNDGRPDIVTTEMQPYYNKRKKLFVGGANYQHYLFTEEYKYQYQYDRNTLQRNSGTNPATGLPIFSELGMFAGVQETDWSWSPLFADFDNDGLRDLYITNGLPRDITDHDFAEFNKSVASFNKSRQELYNMIPQVLLPNFMFKNNGDLSFSDVSKTWGLAIPSFSNGSAYADLDQDGDLDLVTNNIDAPAFVFENQRHLKQKNAAGAFLRIKLEGLSKNPDAFGSKVALFYGTQKQTAYVLSARGYLSKSENTVHFGLGAQASVDSAVVTWPDGRRSVLKNPPVGQTLTMRAAEATAWQAPNRQTETFFRPAGAETGLFWKSEENDFIDFNFQRTIPHKFSQYGPCLAVGDINGDRLDDIFLGGSSRYDETWFVQQADGKFLKKTACYKLSALKKEEDTGALLFDADGDRDNDLYLVRGSGQHPAGDSLYQDVLCINDGAGNFSIAPEALPALRANGSCVKAADFDGDGDLDLFVGSRVLPKAFPLPDRSYLLRNDSEAPDQPRFTEVTEQVCPALLKPGMVSDALWTDFNGDFSPDLILACEWAPLQFFYNQNGKLVDVTQQSGIADKTGWWNSLAGADLDNDGDTDYIAGNFGQNLYFRCNEQEPLRVYAKDFDANGSVDPFISCYWKDSLGAKHEYFYHPREDAIKQLVGLRKKFTTYAAYGAATVQDFFSKTELDGATILTSNWMNTSVLENMGGGKFALRTLPVAAQLAPVYGILPRDVDRDGRMDLLMVGNDYGMELHQGRADAFNGLILINKGGWSFEAAEQEKSRFFVPKDAKSLACLPVGGNREIVLATQNRDSLRVFAPNGRSDKYLPARYDEVKAAYVYQNGVRRVEELYWGSTFGSQQARYIRLDPSLKAVVLYDRKGKVLRTF